MADFELAQVAARTSPGTQDFTASGFSMPKGAVFFPSFGTLSLLPVWSKF